MLGPWRSIWFVGIGVVYPEEQPVGFDLFKPGQDAGIDLAGMMPPVTVKPLAVLIKTLGQPVLLLEHTETDEGRRVPSSVAKYLGQGGVLLVQDLGVVVHPVLARQQ
jgi:hypothetical protein